MSEPCERWVWFLDDDLVESLLRADPHSPSLTTRAATHPAVAEAIRLYLQGDIDGALSALDPAVALANADALLIAGQITFEQQRYEEAATHYRALAQAQPDHRFASYNHGLSLGRLAKWRPAITAMQRAVVLDPDRAQAWFVLGICLLNERRPAEASASFARSIKLRGDYAPAWFGHAAALQLEGKHREALAIYDRLLEEQSGRPQGHPGQVEALSNALSIAMELQDNARVSELTRQLHKTAPKSVVALSALAMEAVDAGDFEAAARWCSAVAEANPASFEGWYNLGVCFERTSQWRMAASAFETALRLRPDDTDGLEGLARSLTEAGGHSKARETWESFLKLAPGRADGWFRLGALRYAAGETAPAAAAFAKCVDVNPAWPEAWSNLAACHWTLGKQAAAEEAYANALRLDPDNQAARRGAIALAIGRSDLDAALRLRDGLAELDWELACGMAMLRHRRGELELAADLYQETLRRNPDCAEGHWNLGHVLFALNRVDGAREHWREAVERRPELAGLSLQPAI